MNFHENTRGFQITSEAWIDAEGCLGWQNKKYVGWAYLPIGKKDPITLVRNIALLNMPPGGCYCVAVAVPASAVRVAAGTGSVGVLLGVGVRVGPSPISSL